jgi:thiol-disulfide isomerase/thioredoxin
MTMHTGRLVLAPKDPYHEPERIDLILEALRGLGLIDQPLPSQSGLRFRLGERFMQLVTFMGCSPYIRLEPSSENQSFNYLWIDENHSRPIFLQGRNTTPPRCGNCRKRIPGWEKLMQEWAVNSLSYQAACPHCGQLQNPAYYDWRQTAGIGRCFVMLENIFPQEAIPSNELLSCLREIDPDNKTWHYFYQQD